MAFLARLIAGRLAASQDYYYMRGTHVSFRRRNMPESPEDRIVPYEGISNRQKKISGEAMPGVILELCDNCKWSCTCFNMKGLVDPCPVCGTSISYIPMTIEEVCKIKHDDRNGITLEFDRQNPLR